MTLADLKIVEIQLDGSDDQSALKNLARRINEMVPLAKSKERDEEEKERYLRNGVVGTDWGLRAMIRTGEQPSLQSIVNALGDSQRELNKHKNKIAKDVQSHAPSSPSPFRILIYVEN